MVKRLSRPLIDVGVEQIRKDYPFTSARDYLYASRLAGSRGINDANVTGRLEGGAYPYSTGNMNYKNGSLGRIWIRPLYHRVFG